MAAKKASAGVEVNLVALASAMKGLGVKQFSYSDEGFAVIFEYDAADNLHDATSTAGFHMDSDEGEE